MTLGMSWPYHRAIKGVIPSQIKLSKIIRFDRHPAENCNKDEKDKQKNKSKYDAIQFQVVNNLFASDVMYFTQDTMHKR